MLVLIGTVLAGCTFEFPIAITFPSETTTTSYTLPNTATGTITFQNEDYNSFPTYRSPSYSLSVDDYNSVLLNTRDMIRHSNIQIVSTIYQESSLPWGHTTETVAILEGSGAIFKEDENYYYALTNYHVVDPEEYYGAYEVKAFGDEVFSSAELVLYNATLDLAVLRFAKNSRVDIHLINITTRTYTKFTPGELVLAVGNPLDIDNNVTFGEFITLQEIANYDYYVIYHSASIHSGSSGGALVDVDGNLLGLNTWGVEDTDESAFAIPNYIIYVFLLNAGMI